MARGLFADSKRNMAGIATFLSMTISSLLTFGAGATFQFTDQTPNGLLFIDSSQKATTTSELIYTSSTGLVGYVSFSDGGGARLPETTEPTPEDSVGQVYPKADNSLYFQDGAGEEHVLHGFPTFKSYPFSSPGGGSGQFYVGGFYEAPTTDANLNQGGTTVTLGSVNESRAAHAFLVAGGAGTTNGVSLVVTVTGTSISDAGVRSTGDSQVIVIDATSSSADQYYETSKKWLGQVTYTLSSDGGTFAYDFNFGFAKYEDFGNFDFTVTNIEMTGRAGANDTNFDVELLFHNELGWTYAASGFLPGNGAIAQLSSDHDTDDQLTNSENFAWKRANLNQFVTGAEKEGTVIRITTSANNSVESSVIHVGVEF